MDLVSRLNKGKMPFKVYEGRFLSQVPAFEDENRIFAGGNIIFKEMLDALTDVDPYKIEGWGQGFDLADFCVAFEHSVKLQANSGFLTGIRGTYIKGGRKYVAIDADAVKAAIKKGTEKYFDKQYRKKANVFYLDRDGEKIQRNVQNIMGFCYDRGVIEFSADQFNAIRAEVIYLKGLKSDEKMLPEEIVEKGKVIHPAWKIYSKKIVVPLVEKLSDFLKRINVQQLMGFYLPTLPLHNAEGRALYASPLEYGLNLEGRYGINIGGSLIIAVHKDYAQKQLK